MGEDLPSGIPIGEISNISAKSDSLFKDIEIKYPINLNRVEVVSVTIGDESS
jgi:cell shape-determining protein MreC